MPTTPASAGDYRLAPNNRDLPHIPGDYGMPYFGKSIESVFRLDKMAQEHYERYGEVSRYSAINVRQVMVLGADNWQRILLDKEQNFSTEMGYTLGVKDFYEGGLLLRDFDEHRVQRRIMQQAFKSAAMQHYVADMIPVMRRHIAHFGDKPLLVAGPALKETLLDVGATIFFGITDKEKGRQLNRAFADITHGFLSQFKKEIPGLGFWRGKRGMRQLHAILANEIPGRRESDKTDMFSHMCRERHEDGSYFSNADIITHGAFLLFAAHDTTTSTLNNLLMLTGMNPQWQEKMRAEVLALGKDELAYEDLDKLQMIDRVFHETLRLYPPAPIGMRRTIRDCELGGYRIPAHTMVMIPFPFNHRDPRYWSNPLQFDPDRFSPERAEHKRHSFCYHPFGGGAHKCIGMHFANMLTKVFMFELLKQYRYHTPAGYKPRIMWLPLPKPMRLPLVMEQV